MTALLDILLADLRGLISDFGKGGGQISGSVYDTALVLRLAPPPEGTADAVKWLLAQQLADGGWGDPISPCSRDTPTLAVILALQAQQRRDDPAVAQAVERGLDFLKRQAPHWKVLNDDLPIGVELTFPRLLEDAARLGLPVPAEQYSELQKLGQRRRQIIAKLGSHPGTPAVHSWEAWGLDPTTSVVDGSMGVGHSPAATAAWLHLAAGRPELADARERARQYLKIAHRATLTDIPGVSPTVHPINWFEVTWGLLPLVCADLLLHPGLRESVRQHEHALSKAVTAKGIGMSDFFIEDGDETAAAVAILQMLGRPVDVSCLKRFEKGEHFVSYHGEIQPSLSTTAHAVMALERLGEDVSRYRKVLVEQQTSDGRWLRDKWQSSWVYTTTHVMFALDQRQHGEALRRALTALLQRQRPDGSWGAGDQATSVETAFGVLGLQTYVGTPLGSEELRRAAKRGQEWLLRQYRPFVHSTHALWIGKELYCPFRIDRSFELTAMLAVALADAGGRLDRS